MYVYRITLLLCQTDSKYDSYSVAAQKLEEKYGDKIYAVQSGEIVAGPEIIKVKVTTAKIQNNKVVLKWQKYTVKTLKRN